MKDTILLMGIVLLAVGCQKAKITENPSQSKLQTKNYYQDLKRQCGSDSCCLFSVGTMEKKNFKLAENSICPDGQKINSILCSSSKEWCEPTDKLSGLDGLQIYSNSRYGFEIKYPKDFELYTDLSKIKAVSYIPVCDAGSLACLLYSKDASEKTNLEGAGVSVSILKNSGNEASCLMEREGEGKTGSVNINGQDFSIYKGGGAAAGHSEEHWNYRAFKNSKCFQVTLRISEANIGNYDPALGVKQYDQNELRAKQEQILSTFQFLFVK